jgi:selenide,water dikinase
LSVTGFVHPDRILTKRDLKLADRLILTKPLGTGIINTAIKGGLAAPEITERITHLMATLNRDAAEVMQNYPVHACTDITGFGLLGHVAEMLVDSPLGIRLASKSIPVIPEALDYARMGFVPAGAYKNREFRECMIDFSSSVDPILQDVLFDPQTSGGLLIGAKKESAEGLCAELQQKGMREAAIVGEVVSEPNGRIVVE